MSFCQPFILYRDSLLEGSAELDAIIELFPDHHGISLDSMPSGSIVFPRFNSIPFGQALEASVTEMGSTLVNNWEQYEYISRLFDWVKDLEGLTPPAYVVDDIGTLPEGEYFVKGELNSDKHDWLHSAFAPNVEAIKHVVSNLKNHSVISHQNLVIRPFVRYRQLASMPTGQPLINEWRVFVLGGKVMAYGFYWSQQIHLIPSQKVDMLDESKFFDTIDMALDRLGDKVNFIAIDIAEKVDGSWDVIEINDANMSGLCGVDAHTLWSNVKNHYS